MFLSPFVSRKASLCLFLVCAAIATCSAQSFDGIERSRMKDMLKIIKDDVKKNYYDQTFHGIDLEQRFKKAEDRLNQVQSTPEALGVIAQTLIDFNDSHLYFMPPPTNVSVEYGWRMKEFGDKTFITAIKPGSDAEKKGLKVGDQILSVSGYTLQRSELWKVIYFYNVLSKRSSLTLDVQSPAEAAPWRVEIESEVKRRPQSIQFSTYFRLFDDFYSEENSKHRFYRVGNINVWHMPDFEMMPQDVDGAMDRFERAAPLIIDLRSNGGGYVKALERLAGYFFDKDVQIAELKGRKEMDPMVAKAHTKDLFTGKVVVLVDSQSASAAEIFARMMQLEKRGIVLGDLSSGSVMQAQAFDEKMGTDSIVPFGVSITNADVIMSDGKSIEHQGVVPNELILPTGADLRAGRDVVLARAVEVLGGHIDPVEAGKMTVYYWK